ncbi:hypothetical protein HPB47_019053 [Ixodes persulcatus]|uniref:Uncharacterized protein n=1 Tax=Ixodes persulcatus TaxID=34615 RepID=A0AC60R115_IXOPE|nr:hypothetical protein HPB47_019053 [Ixodes persulcatus]
MLGDRLKQCCPIEFSRLRAARSSDRCASTFASPTTGQPRQLPMAGGTLGKSGSGVWARGGRMSAPLSGRDHVGQERREVPDPKGCCRKHGFREGPTATAMWPHDRARAVGEAGPTRPGLQLTAFSGTPLFRVGFDDPLRWSDDLGGRVETESVSRCTEFTVHEFDDTRGKAASSRALPERERSPSVPDQASLADVCSEEAALVTKRGPGASREHRPPGAPQSHPGAEAVYQNLAKLPFRRAQSGIDLARGSRPPVRDQCTDGASFSTAETRALSRGKCGGRRAGSSPTGSLARAGPVPSCIRVGPAGIVVRAVVDPAEEAPFRRLLTSPAGNGDPVRLRCCCRRTAVEVNASPATLTATGVLPRSSAPTTSRANASYPRSRTAAVLASPAAHRHATHWARMNGGSARSDGEAIHSLPITLQAPKRASSRRSSSFCYP